VQLKVRFADLFLITRSQTLPEPTDIADELWRAHDELLCQRFPAGDSHAHRPASRSGRKEIDLATLGSPSVSRVSHVESDQQGRWWADLSPVGGNVLGPFTNRSEALAAEQAWLEMHWLVGQSVP
jgi:hypothetical protein